AVAVLHASYSGRPIPVGALAFLGYLLSIYLLGLAVGFRFISVIFNVVERYGELTKPAQTIGLALSAGLLVGGALWVHWWAARAEREFRRDMGEVMRGSSRGGW